MCMSNVKYSFNTWHIAIMGVLCNGCQMFYCSVLMSVDQMFVTLQKDEIA